MEKEVKTNQNGKKASIVVIVVSIVVIIAVLGFWGVLKLQAKQAEKKVTGILSELKNGNTEMLNEYLTSEDFSEGLMDLGVEMEEEEARETTAGNKKFFSNLDYKVKKSQANFRNAKVEIEITNKDMGKVMSNYFKKSMQLLFQSALSSALPEDDDSDEELTKKMVQYLEDELNSDSIEKVTKNITIELSKENGKWVVKTEGKAIVDAILPGFVEVMKNFDDPLLDQESDEILPDEDLNQDTDNQTEQQVLNNIM